MARRKGRKGRRKGRKSKRRGGKRKARRGGLSFRGAISYTPCRDSKGVFRKKSSCGR